MNKVFLDAVEDEVYCTLYVPDGITGQLTCNWTDSCDRKTETRLTIWGSDGHISVDRQAIRLYLRGTWTRNLNEEIEIICKSSNRRPEW